MRTQWTLLAVSVLLAACALPSQSAVKQVTSLEQWENYGMPAQLNVNDLADNQALAVFYRLDDVTGAPVNVYVNGDYQASLRENTFSAVGVCANKQLFSASFVSHDTFGNRKYGTHHTLPLQDIAYMKIVLDANGQPNFVRVPAQLAMQEVASLRKAQQTLSRVPDVRTQNCTSPVVLQTETVSANALFGYNQFSSAHIEPSGWKELANIAQRAKSLADNRIGKIVVSGHTDPDGTDEYNKILSQKRAESVRQILLKQGVTVPIEAVGLGKSELLVQNCAQLHSHDAQARLACNLPNRRVEITIYGK